MIALRQDDRRQAATWETLLDIEKARPAGWTLIGAQMVALHALEHGLEPPRATLDADLLVNVRVAAGTESFSALLLEKGFALEGINAHGIGHRFRNGLVTIDVLAPDGLSPRASRTTLPPARTVSVPGGTQALARTESVSVSLGAREGRIPRPNLLGAILVKARAIASDDLPDAQMCDLAFLLSIVPDPRSLAADLRPTERRWLTRYGELADPRASPWRVLPIDAAENGLLAFRLLTVR